MYFSVSEAGFLLGVCPTTIRRWDKLGKIKCIRTLGGHRRIDDREIGRIIDGKSRRNKRRKPGVVVYSRVSSHEQKKKGDLKRQEDKLLEYCERHKLSVSYTANDVASGLNANRKGLRKIFGLVTGGKVSEIVVTYQDRLTRFGFRYLSSFFDSYGVKIRVIEELKVKDVRTELVDDLIAIITSFSGKIHGLRGRKKKLQIELPPLQV